MPPTPAAAARRRWLWALPLAALVAAALWAAQSPAIDPRLAFWRPTATSTPTATPTATATPTPTATATATPTATLTPTPTFTPTATTTPTDTPSPRPTATKAPPAAAVAAATVAPHAGTGLVLANYFAWYGMESWDACNISAGDRPAQPYNSDDPAVISRQLQQAIGAGIDGFTLQWFAPGERTDRNLGTLLAKSTGTSFRSTVVFLRHIYPGPPAASQAEVVKALRYLADTYMGNSAWLKIDGRPVIFFADMDRIALEGQASAQAAWAAIRAQADPEHKSWWIAEGLDASYLETFDGLYVYKVTHAAYPEDYQKAARWAANVRAWEQRTGQRKLWWGTLMPGWDDTRSACRSDIRTPSQPFNRDRADGAFYRATANAALASGPDGLWINSFNEWVEGSYIEPSQRYGERYLQLTKELTGGF